MKTSYFTFGQQHVHSLNGKTFDKNVIVEITSEDPRQMMVDNFGGKWGFQYDNLNDLHTEYYKKKYNLNENKFIEL
jgi:hypothetical protein